MTIRATHIIMTSLSLLLSFGIFVHDSHVDKAYSNNHGDIQAITQRPIEESRTPHVHPEFNPMGATLSKSFAYQNPSIAPRRDSHHKELLRILESGGRHAFDNATLPIVS